MPVFVYAAQQQVKIFQTQRLQGPKIYECSQCDLNQVPSRSHLVIHTRKEYFVNISPNRWLQRDLCDFKLTRGLVVVSAHSLIK